VRHCFIAEPVLEHRDAALDQDILDTAWLSMEEIQAHRNELRSPLVIKALEDFLDGKSYPLAIINSSK